jgi:hypothetical protein
MSEYSNEELDKLKKTFDTFDKDDFVIPYKRIE